MGAKFSLSRMNKYMANGSVPTINTTTEVVTTETVTNQTITNLTSSTALITGAATVQGVTNLEGAVTGSTALFTGAVTIQGAATFTGAVSGISNTALTVGVDGTTAATGTDAAGAAQLPAGSTLYVTTSAVDDNGVKINASDATSGRLLYIINEGPKRIKVYPNTGATIDGTTFYKVDSGKVITAGYYAANKWFVIKTA